VYWFDLTFDDDDDDVLSFLQNHSVDLMIQNAQVARDDLILENRTRWNIDSVSVIRNDDDRALETDILAKGHIAGNSQMVSLEHVRNGFEAAREFRHLLEVFIAEFDKWRRFELALLGHEQRARFQLVQVRHHQHQVRCFLDGEETCAGDVDANGVLKVFDGRTRRSLELNDICAIRQRLLIDNDLHIIDLPVLTQPINGVNTQPQIVRIENLEL